MKKLILLIVTLLFPFSLAANTYKAGKVGFVNVSQILLAYPPTTAFAKYKQQVDGEINEIYRKAKAIQQKGSAASAAERKSLTQYQARLSELQKKYQAEANKRLLPAMTKLNVIIKTVAQKQGYTIIMEKSVAARGLVVYANSQVTDLTASVIKALPKK